MHPVPESHEISDRFAKALTDRHHGATQAELEGAYDDMIREIAMDEVRSRHAMMLQKRCVAFRPQLVVFACPRLVVGR